MKNQLKPEVKLHYLKLVYFGDINKPYQVAGTRAYRDFCRTIELKDGRKSSQKKRAEIRNRIISDIEKEIKSLDNLNLNQEMFDIWHKKICDEIVKKYKTQADLTYGQAQKWLNMTLKYLLVLDVKEVVGIMQYLHIPIDNVIIKKVAEQFKIKPPAKRWSQLCEPKYIEYQNKIRENMGKNICPIMWEFDNWEPLALLES